MTQKNSETKQEKVLMPVVGGKLIILTGQWGGGKTVTALSFTPWDWKPGKPVQRYYIDMELRAADYKSIDEKDNAEILAFSYIDANGGGRFSGDKFAALMLLVHKKEYKKSAPDVIIIDDAAAFQDAMRLHWNNKENAVKCANIYGLGHIAQLNQKAWKPNDPGTIAQVFKRLFEEFLLDCRQQGITVILTSPLHNIWENYGSREYEDGKPKMKILGKTAKVWDVWVKYADVIWNLDRLDPQTRNLRNLPHVAMDPYFPKQSFLGIPEQFEWPGWPTLWQWHRERKFVADLTKLTVQEPEYDPDVIADATKAHKRKLYADLLEVATVDQINSIMTEEHAPEYTIEGHEDIVAYVKRVIAERELTKEEAKAPEEPPTEEEPAEPEEPKAKKAPAKK